MNYRHKDVWYTPINKLMFYQNNKWIPYEQNIQYTYHLRIHNDMAFIVDGEKMIERWNFKAKGFYKNNMVVIVICNGAKQIRKIRFQFRADDVEACIQKLSCRFPIVNIESNLPAKKVRYRTLEEILKCAVDSIGNSNHQLEMPPNYEEFLKVCLLDPTFPRVVEETQKIIEKISNN